MTCSLALASFATMLWSLHLSGTQLEILLPLKKLNYWKYVYFDTFSNVGSVIIIVSLQILGSRQAILWVLSFM